MTVLTAQSISRLALDLLVLPRTAAMVPGTEFTGSNGDTITVRVRQPRAARVQATPGSPITYDALDEVPVELTVAHLYNGTQVTDEQLSLELVDFGGQVLAPMAASVAIGAEDQLAAVMNGLAADGTIQFALNASEDDTEGVILAARERLSDNDAPLGNRWFAVSPDIATRLLSVDKFVQVDQSGSPSALRDAVIGRLYGFNFVESNALAPGTAVAYHSSGFVWGNRAPANPRGAGDSAVSANEGIALRTIYAFDPDVLSDRVVISTFAGAAAVYEDAAGTDARRFIKIGTSAT